MRYLVILLAVFSSTATALDETPNNLKDSHFLDTNHLPFYPSSNPLSEPHDAPWYHCVTRCVRRAFLCGEDHHSGRSYEHRRGWISARIKQLAGIYAIDIAGYAVMSNHAHVVVRIDRERALDWPVQVVLERWTALFTGPLLVTRYLSAEREAMSQAEVDTVLARRRFIGSASSISLGSCAR